MKALSFVNFVVFLVVFLVHDNTFFISRHFVFHLHLSFTEKGIGYGGVTWIDFTTSARKCILWYKGEGLRQTLFAFVLFYVSLDLIAILFTTQYFEYVWSYNSTKLHKMYWIFRWYSVIRKSTTVNKAIFESFRAIFSNFNTVRRRWPNMYVCRYDPPNAAGT